MMETEVVLDVVPMFAHFGSFGERVKAGRPQLGFVSFFSRLLQSSGNRVQTTYVVCFVDLLCLFALSFVNVQWQMTQVRIPLRSHLAL